MGSSGIRCRARLRTYKRLIVGHVLEFKTPTPSIRGLIMPEYYFWLSDGTVSEEVGTAGYY